MALLTSMFESGRIDFKGQELVSKLATFLIVGSALAAVIVGYSQHALSLCFYTYVAGVALTYIVVLPAWPFYKRNPVKWLPRKQAVAGNNTAPALVDSPNQPTSRKTLVEDVSDDEMDN
ncbi:hypothetical protein LPJ66_011056 [Kickxella alabastrina]|uniref:Uncharacterized protein n=1 Tax=Kickxella alabastrina TaxID=61397 RepID=A0ACC1HZD5_9FUNG|nr:hypothetical protein LPJ66_011056 [Kickxella alabastrina]